MDNDFGFGSHRDPTIRFGQRRCVVSAGFHLDQALQKSSETTSRAALLKLFAAVATGGKTMSSKTRVTLLVATLFGSAAVANAQTADGTAAKSPDLSVSSMIAPPPAMAAGPSSGAMGETGMGKMMAAMRGMTSMMAADHVEDRIAYQKAELAITDAQLPEWNAVAAVLRLNAKSMQDGMARMAKDGMPTAAPARGEMMVSMMSERLEGMKKLGEASKALYAVSTPDQRKTADDMAANPMGMM